MHEGLRTQLKFSTIFHPQTDGQSKRTIKILEDMLRACVLNFGGAWDQYLALAEFTYNNSYQTTIRLAPYEALYGQQCRTPLCWDEPNDPQLLQASQVPLLKDVIENIQLILRRMLTTQSLQKSYHDKHRRSLEFQVGDEVLLKLSPLKGMVRVGQSRKLNPRYVGPFKILKRIGRVAYRLELPENLTGIHNVFHVSQLRRYIFDSAHVIRLEDLEIAPNLTFGVHPIEIIGHRLKQLRRKVVSLVLVLWQRHGAEEMTWETEESMRRFHPILFESGMFSREKNSKVGEDVTTPP